jgi:hypothetical protein
LQEAHGQEAKCFSIKSKFLHVKLA